MSGHVLMPAGVTLAALSTFERRQLETVWELVSSSSGVQRDRKLQAKVCALTLCGGARVLLDLTQRTAAAACAAVAATCILAVRGASSCCSMARTQHATFHSGTRHAGLGSGGECRHGSRAATVDAAPRYGFHGAGALAVRLQLKQAASQP